MKDIQIKVAIKEGRIVMTTALMTQKGVVGFNVYWHRNNINTLEAITEGPHWNDNKGCHYSTATGTDRRMEILLALGAEQGLKHSDINQNIKWL